jgi:hypothetical protein
MAGGDVLEASARKLALRTGHLAEALFLADTAAGDELASLAARALRGAALKRFVALRIG